MPSFQQVQQLMYYHIFYTILGVSTQPDADGNIPCTQTAASPLGSCISNRHLAASYTKNPLPFIKQRRQKILQALFIFPFQFLFSFIRVVLFWDQQFFLILFQSFTDSWLIQYLNCFLIGQGMRNRDENELWIFRSYPEIYIFYIFLCNLNGIAIPFKFFHYL